MTTCTYESIRLIAITTLLAYKNDDVFILVFNVISTEVRVKPERSGELPRWKSVSSVYASKSFLPRSQHSHSGNRRQFIIVLFTSLCNRRFRRRRRARRTPPSPKRLRFCVLARLRRLLRRPPLRARLLLYPRNVRTSFLRF